MTAEPLYAGGPVTCDRCGEEFTPELVETPPAPVGGEVFQYFDCSCGAHYPVCRISAEGLVLRERLALMESRQQRAATRKRHQQIRRLRAELRQHVTRSTEHRQ